MAKRPTAKQKKQYLASTQAAIEEKIKSQENPSKPFEITGAGVLPEDIWKKHKVQEETK